MDGDRFFHTPGSGGPEAQAWHSPALSRPDRRPGLKRDGQQGVEAAAVADDDTLHEAQAAGFVADPIEVDSGREQIGSPVAHDARDQKGRLRSQAIVSGLADYRQPDDMAVAVPLVDVRAPQCGDPVVQHRTRIGVDDAGAVAAFAVIGRGDLVETVLDEEIGPGLQPVGVDCRGIGSVELRNPQQGAHTPVIRRHSDQKPRTEASVARVAWLSMPAPPISTMAASLSAAAMPRSTNPPTQPSSIDTKPAGPPRFRWRSRRRRISGVSSA